MYEFTVLFKTVLFLRHYRDHLFTVRDSQLGDQSEISADFLIAVTHNSSVTLKSLESPALKGQTENSEMSSYQHCANQVTDLRVVACSHCFILIMSIPNSPQYPF